MAKHTKIALAEAMKARLQKTKLENITVKDLTADCGLNRQSFYYHFSDVYALAEWVFEEEIKKLMVEHVRRPDVKGALLLLADYYKENEKTILHAYESIDRRLTDKYLRKWATPIITDIVKTKAEGKDINESDCDFIINFCIMTVLGVLFEAIENDMVDEIGSQADRLSILADGSLDEIIDRFARKKNSPIET